MSRRRAFTLIEMMISIGIFVVAATAMLTMLFGATELFRRGEAARQAGDEATLVTAALRDDLARVVPVRLRNGAPAAEWGWMRGALNGGAGNCLLGMVITNPDAAMLSSSGVANAGDARTGARQYVCWFVAPDPDDPTDASKAQLRRAVYPAGTGTSRPNPAATDGVVMCYGCLHFGVWFELAQAHRRVTAVSAGGSDVPAVDWETDQPPFAGLPLDTDQQLTAGGITFWPQPDAVRVSLVLTGGGRYAVRGTLARDLAAGDNQAVIAGIKALPTISGSILRIGDEWVRYADFRSGIVTVADPATGRGALRSGASGHAARTPVYAGQPFSIVVELPR